MAWLYLLIGGILEVCFAFMANKAEGYTKLGPTVLTAVIAVLSVWCISLAMKIIPVGTAYAVWTGIGAFGTALIGILFFGEPKDLPRIFFLSLIIIGAVGLNFVSGE